MKQEIMKALVYHAPGKISLDDVPVPKIVQPTDAIVRVTLSTICGSDIHIIAGHTPVKYPKIMGHEFCGEIVELGSAVKNLKIGEKVAVSCISSCGECYYCKMGQHVHCTDPDSACFGTEGNLDGCQAEFIRVPHASYCTYKIPDGFSEEDMLFVGDILSTGYFAAENASIQPGDTVLIIGAGPVGMCAATCARLWGPAKIIISDLIQSRVDVSLKEGIADVGLNPKNEDVVKIIRELTEGRGSDRVIEAVGLEETLTTALEAVRVNGNVSTIGVYAESVSLQLQKLWSKTVTLRWGFVPVDHMPELIKLIQEGKINIQFLMTHRAPLNDIVKGYDIFGNKKDGCLKWVVTPYER